MPESADDFYARLAALADDEGRLPFTSGAEEWETFPLQSDTWRLRPIDAPAALEPPRQGEHAHTCWCGTTGDSGATEVWQGEHWRITRHPLQRLPVVLFLEPRRHHDLDDLPPEQAAEMGRLLSVLGTAVEALPSVGRAHLSRWGDGHGHLHWWVFGRPARIPQLRGSFLPLWEEYLPQLPEDVVAQNTAFVVARVVDAVGGRAVSDG